ncbi:MAG: phosphorylase kinase, partial [Cyanobium sp.]
MLSLPVEGVALLPELYRVPEAALAAERAQPGSQERLANDNVPLLWTQSLTWLGDLLLEGLITPEDLDPCGRRLPAPLGASEVLVAFAPSDGSVASALRQAGLPAADPAAALLAGGSAGVEPRAIASLASLPDDDPPLRVASSRELAQRMAVVGANARLGLSGHPPVRMDTMATARLYRHGNERIAFLPAVLDDDTFYLADDPLQLVDAVASELRLLQRHWRGAGLPVLLIPVPAGPFRRDPEAFLALGRQLLAGSLEGVPVQLASQQALLSQACWVDLPEQALAACDLRPRPHTLLPPITSRAPLTALEEQELDDTSESALVERLWASGALQE